MKTGPRRISWHSSLITRPALTSMPCSGASKRPRNSWQVAAMVGIAMITAPAAPFAGSGLLPNRPREVAKADSELAAALGYVRERPLVFKCKAVQGEHHVPPALFLKPPVRFRFNKFEIRNFFKIFITKGFEISGKGDHYGVIPSEF